MTTSSERTARRTVPQWSTPLEGLLLIARGYTMRTGVVVATVVGTLLSAVNQGATLITGHVGTATWLRIATNYVVPFFVSSIGYLAPSRRIRRRDAVSVDISSDDE